MGKFTRIALVLQPFARLFVLLSILAALTLLYSLLFSRTLDHWQVPLIVATCWGFMSYLFIRIFAVTFADNIKNASFWQRIKFKIKRAFHYMIATITLVLSFFCVFLTIRLLKVWWS